MDIFAYFVLFCVVILFIIILPLLSNVGNFKIGRPSSRPSDQDVPTSNRQRLKNAINDPNLLKFKLKKEPEDNYDDNTSGKSSANTRDGKFEIDNKTGLKKRIIGRKVVDASNPNEFDYDLEELINEDRIEEERAEAKRMSKFKGKEQETYEELV
ncbi:Exp1p NDAI_0B03420 [Naumovozyma dairenensis CBS 421]|uniref:Uncharacterized protein n=1 Tax=Naumovozyma dairenensis (strain ATCC 10597 / BCRC 20456 / CBS 421 / NBRC 0211 / NRRL Y-12639) TaxID=1071378 RepID=G0W6G5_NAUDC|nr:hypothetical protein NDAI_0B03420 [Naumovozyma dairenensis CBS 421]CCD23376.1 hypothetical protein NDAI_0B03420 [Naumovozyma dairenensis CBS 421]